MFNSNTHILIIKHTTCYQLQHLIAVQPCSLSRQCWQAIFFNFNLSNITLETIKTLKMQRKIKQLNPEQY